MNLPKILHSIGAFFAVVWGHAKEGFEALPKEQQGQAIMGVNLSQTAKELYKEGKDAVVNEVAEKLSVPVSSVEAAFLAVGKDLGLETDKAEDVIGHFAEKVEKGLTDNGWNELWQFVAKSAASYFSGGQISWVTLSMGAIETALHLFVKKDQ